MRAPRLYLGTMTFGWTSQTSSKVDESVAAEMLRLFITQQNINEQVVDAIHIDTARIYAGGQTEPIVSHALSQQQSSLSASNRVNKSFIVGTKAHPSQLGGLSSSGITAQMNTSRAAIPNVTSFGEYYLHQPDPDNSLLESLQCLHSFYEQGLISAIGMSNYHASEMERAFELCQEYKLTPPTVYQGLYNPLNRMVEAELLPILRKNKCSFIAYNPLAGGLLTGKYQNNNSRLISGDGTPVPHGRFKDNPNYLPRFFTDPNFEAVAIIQKACNDAQIGMVEATYRWLMYHSALTENDGILIGASSITQLEQNLNVLCSNNQDYQKLPDSILNAFADAWEITKRVGVFPYWRSFSSDMPNRDDLDQGASYDAVKKPT